MRNPLSLDAFIDWLEKQPGDARYDYIDGQNCLIGQYNKFLGLPMPGSYGSTQKALGMNAHPGAGVWGYTPHTFGAALERAKAFRADSGEDA